MEGGFKTGRIIAQGPIPKCAIISIFTRMASDSVSEEQLESFKIS